MKKLLASVLAGTMALSMVACGGSSASSAPAAASSAPAAASSAAASVAESVPAGGTVGVCIYKFDDAFMTTYRNALTKILEDKGYTFLSADIAMVPQNYISLTDEGDLKNMQKLIDMLEDNDDVQNVWHNWENE